MRTEKQPRRKFELAQTIQKLKKDLYGQDRNKSQEELQLWELNRWN